MIKLATVLALIAVVWTFRKHLIHLLMRFTGTWVGSPDG